MRGHKQGRGIHWCTLSQDHEALLLGLPPPHPTPGMERWAGIQWGNWLPKLTGNGAEQRSIQLRLGPLATNIENTKISKMTISNREPNRTVRQWRPQTQAALQHNNEVLLKEVFSKCQSLAAQEACHSSQRRTFHRMEGHHSKGPLAPCFMLPTFCSSFCSSWILVHLCRFWSLETRPDHGNARNKKLKGKK